MRGETHYQAELQPQDTTVVLFTWAHEHILYLCLYMLSLHLSLSLYLSPSLFLSPSLPLPRQLCFRHLPCRQLERCHSFNLQSVISGANPHQTTLSCLSILMLRKCVLYCVSVCVNGRFVNNKCIACPN